MSSLAGALDTNNSIGIHPSFDDISPDTATPKQDDEMGDLFGEDANIDFVHHSRSV